MGHEERLAMLTEMMNRAMEEQEDASAEPNDA